MRVLSPVALSSTHPARPRGHLRPSASSGHSGDHPARLIGHPAERATGERTKGKGPDNAGTRSRVVLMSTPDTPPASMPEQASGGARPRFSESQAAKLCGVARATIQRARKRGDIPGAERTEQGWSLPLEGLLAAGFTPQSGQGTPIGAPRSPAHAQEHAPEHPTPAQGRETESEVRRLEQELAEALADARVARVERDAARAVAAERERIIALLEQRSQPIP